MEFIESSSVCARATREIDFDAKKKNGHIHPFIVAIRLHAYENFYVFTFASTNSTTNNDRGRKWASEAVRNYPRPNLFRFSRAAIGALFLNFIVKRR